jgi:hypothetical protein
LNDLFNRNPIEYLDNSKRTEYNKEMMNSVKLKTERVSNYLGSNGIKESFNYKGKELLSDKITNTNKDTLIKTINQNEKKNYKTNASHIFEGNHGYYK